MPVKQILGRPLKARDRRISPVRRFPHQKPLDGLRGLAALGVLLLHTCSLDLPTAGLPWHLAFLKRAFYYGDYGVTLFFVLSGYLITSLLLLDRRQPYFFHNFYWKRVFRVLPPLILVLLLTHWLGYTNWLTILLTLLFILNFCELMHLPYAVSGPFWTLSIEEQFYVVWPAVVRFSSPRTMRNCMVVLIVAVPLIRILSAALGHGRMHYTFMECDTIAWGALLALIAYRYRIPYRAKNMRWLWRRYGLPMLLTGATLAIVSEIFMQRSNLILHTTMMGAILFITGLLIFSICQPQAWLSRLLTSRPLLFLGNISYMMYLIHAYILAEFTDHIAGKLNVSLPEFYYLRLLFTLGLTILFCTASLYLMERPVNRLRRYMLK